MKQYKRAILILSLGIMLIGLISFRLVPASNTNTSPVNTVEGVPNNEITSTPMITPVSEVASSESNTGSSDDSSTSPSVTPEVTEPADNSEVAEPTPEAETENTLLREAYPEIHILVEKYLNAKLDCTMVAFRDVVTDTRYINLEKVAESTESIRAYDDIVCYTKRGYGEIDLIVYCTYNMEIVKIDTPVPSIDEFYVQYDDQGKPKIFGGNLDSTTIEELDKITAETDVQRLIESTTEQIRQRLQTDEDLREFWDNLLNKIDDGENV